MDIPSAVIIGLWVSLVVITLVYTHSLTMPRVSVIDDEPTCEHDHVLSSPNPCIECQSK